ncbi:putative endoribonuclease L-PSP [Staphylococcus gallinarum]|uniref:Putative endoribonuclease L-PSP n=1 Tax=Staphylococcus gallinarum TaxID=1293 RepID=A0A380FAM0_STAGA|nr:putative endoribonuclease L-PSP [Staphylococcus gallinarum]
MKFITTNEAPQAIGPYSQAVQARRFPLYFWTVTYQS